MTDLPLGLIRGMSNADYHASDAISASFLKEMAVTPYHAMMSRHPEAPDRQTNAKRAGTLLHTLVLEPETFATRYSVKPDDHDGRTRKGQAWMAALGEREPVTHLEHDTAKRQAEAIRALPDIAKLLTNGEAEVSAFWIDQETGVHCRCRPDWVCHTKAGAVLLDLKTTKDPSPAGFPWEMRRYGYGIQAAHYSDGWEAATGEPVLAFWFAAVGSAWPHPAKPYLLSDEDIEESRRRVRELLALTAQCQASGEWPAWGSDTQIISLPKRA